MTNLFLKSDIDLSMNDISSFLDTVGDISFGTNFLIKKKKNDISKILKFLSTDYKILSLEVLSDILENRIFNVIKNFVSDDCIFIEVIGSNALNLDNLLLNLNQTFTNLFYEEKFVSKTIPTNNITERVNYYFSNVTKPILLYFNNFNKISLTEIEPIKEFLGHLLKNDNIKIIYSFSNSKSVTSQENLVISDISQADKKEFLNLFQAYFIESSENDMSELKDINIITAFLLVNFLKQNSKSFAEFMIEIRESKIGIDKFLFFKVLDSFKNNIIPALSFLFLIRHEVNGEYLIKNELLTSDDLNKLNNSYLIILQNNKCYLSDFGRKFVKELIVNKLEMEISEFLIEFYKSQLKLSPYQRELLISRKTMRSEIEYHSGKIKILQNSLLKEKSANISYLGSAFIPEWLVSNMSKKKSTNSFLDKKEEQKSDKKEEDSVYNNADEEIPLSEEEKLLLDKETTMPTEKTNDSDEKDGEKNSSESKRTLKEYALNKVNNFINSAKEEELKHNYAKALLLYEEMHNMLKNDDYIQYEGFVLTKIALQHEKLQNYEQSISFLDEAYEKFDEKEEFVKANYILLKKAKILVQIYKYKQAEKAILNILQHEKINPVSMNSEAYMILGDIKNLNSNINGALADYKKAIEISKDDSNNELLAEIYFKYALLLDDIANLKLAKIFYLKCIKLALNDKNNKFISSAYSNLASIYLEEKLKTEALENFKKAIEIDTYQNNIEGLYFIYSKLGAYYFKSNKIEKAIKYQNKALEFAKQMEDDFYLVKSYTNLGDIYAYEKKYEEALKNYNLSKKYLKKGLDDFNIQKIEARINDINVSMKIK